MPKDVGFFFGDYGRRGVPLSTLTLALELSKSEEFNVVGIFIVGLSPWIQSVDRGFYHSRLRFMEFKDSRELGLYAKKHLDCIYIQGDSLDAVESVENDTLIIWHVVFPGAIKKCLKQNHLNESRRISTVFVSPWLERIELGTSDSSMPLIHTLNSLTYSVTDLRPELHIGESDFVLASYGGRYTFDSKTAIDGISRLLNKYGDLWFISMNHEKFINHRRAVFLPGSHSVLEKHRFVNTCNAMLHGRAQGETFGLSCAEFAYCSKPIISWRDAPERAHIELFCKRDNLYWSIRSLEKIVARLKSKQQESGESYHPTASQLHNMSIDDVFLGKKGIAVKDLINRYNQRKLHPSFILGRGLLRIRSRAYARERTESLSDTLIDPISGYPVE